MKSIIFDTETTGFPTHDVETQPYIIELGAIFIDDDGSIIRTISQLLNPGDRIWDSKTKSFTDQIPPAASKVNGITKDMLVDKPTFGECFILFCEFFYGADMLIAHNAPFDVKLLKCELQRVDNAKASSDSFINLFPMPPTIIDTIQEYKHILGGKWPKMTELYEKIMGKKLEQTHRALDDCNALHEILVKDRFFEKIAEGQNGSLPTLQ